MQPVREHFSSVPGRGRQAEAIWWGTRGETASDTCPSKGLASVRPPAAFDQVEPGEENGLHQAERDDDDFPDRHGRL